MKCKKKEWQLSDSLWHVILMNFLNFIPSEQIISNQNLYTFEIDAWLEQQKSTDTPRVTRYLYLPSKFAQPLTPMNS